MEFLESMQEVMPAVAGRRKSADVVDSFQANYRDAVQYLLVQNHG
jgi:hypothetical protein